MKTKTIEDYYCTAAWQTEKIHINSKWGKIYKTSCGLQLISYHSLKIHSSYIKYGTYKDLCKTCIKRLPDNVREEVIYNFVLAKVKK